MRPPASALALAALCLQLCVLSHSAEPEPEKPEPEPEDEPDLVDLYQPDGPVVHLDHSNFEEQLRHKSHVWVVEFYNSWCGHCQLYAPTWRSFAQQISGWSAVARVGAINCARAKNLAVCREYDIDAYPWVKFFAPLSRKGDLGEHRAHLDAGAMMSTLVQYAHQIQSQSHPPRWPSLDAFQGSVSSLLSSPEPLHALILESDANSTVGRELLLDFSQHRRLRLVRALQPPADLRLPADSSSSSSRPLLVSWRRGQRAVVPAPDGLPARNLFRRELRALLGLQQVYDAALVTRDVVGKPPAPPAGQGVYMADLENAVAYALSHEVAGKKAIAGDAMVALRGFLGLLVEHGPWRRSVRQALQRVQEVVAERPEMAGEEVQRLLETAALPRHRDWQGCRGSRPGYRGYPCALWTLFHTLTVAANEASMDGASVLPQIHGYVKYFFSCAHCSQHFQKMAVAEGLFNVTKANQAAVWLWRAHNLVNRRLAGDASEDPDHPKQQFPSRDQCPACFNAGEYVPVIVLAFMRSFYGAGVIKLDGLEGVSPGLQPTAAPPAPAAGAAAPQAPAPAAPASPSPVPVVWRQPVRLGPISDADLSLCVLLWGFSFLMLITAFLLFRMKRRYKRKTSHLLPGPYP